MATTTKKTGAEAEVKQEAEVKAEAKQETAVKEEKKTSDKVYRFTSDNKFLTCSALGIQFMNGKASTANLEVARALAKIDGVKLVEG